MHRFQPLFVEDQDRLLEGKPSGEEELQKGDGPYQDSVRNRLDIEMAQQVIQGIDAGTVPAGSHKTAHDKAV